MSKLVLIVGGTGAGKTTYTKKNFLNAKKGVIYDTNNEYSEFPFVGLDKINGPGMKRISTSADFDSFINSATLSDDSGKIIGLNNSTVIIEDCTIYLTSNIQQQNFKKFLISKRHANNFIVLLFHSLGKIPVFCYELANYMVLLKTNDYLSKVESKFKEPKIVDAFMLVREKALNESYPVVTVKIQ